MSSRSRRVHFTYWTGLLLPCAIAAYSACNKPSDEGATTQQQTTPGSTPLTPVGSTQPANPRRVTMKGAPVGSTVAGEQPVSADGGALH